MHLRRLSISLAGRNPNLSSVEKRIMCWFAITGAVHMFIEGKQNDSRCFAVLPCNVSS